MQSLGAIVTFSVFFFSLTIICTQAASRYLKTSEFCSQKNVAKADETLKQLTSLGEGSRYFPENQKQLKTYCSDSTQMIAYLDKFISTCYTSEVKDLSKIMIFSVKNAIKQFCKKKTKKLQDLLGVTPCINRNLRHGPCYNSFLNSTRNIQHIRDDKMKMPHLCCNYVTLNRCIENELQALECARQGTSTIMDFIHSIVGNMANVACGEWNESSDRCDHIGPMPKPTKVSNKKYASFLFLVIDLLDSIK